jgi:hypothetical protein
MKTASKNDPTPEGTRPTVGKNAFDPEGDGSFSFIVLGDSQPYTMGMDVFSQTNQFHSLIEIINESVADFAVNLGDLIRGYSGAIPRFNAPKNERIEILYDAYNKDHAGHIEKMWDAYDNTCQKINIPYVSLAGNHDVWSDQAYLVWQKRYGPLYFSWKHKGCYFIALSSELRDGGGKIGGSQLEWLKSKLSEAKGARAIFIFIHKPYWTKIKWNRKNDLVALGGVWDPDHWKRHIHPLLVQHRVKAVFAGHIHNYYQFPTKDGVQYIVTGGGGPEAEILHNSTDEYLDGTPKLGYEIAGKFLHYLWIEAGNNDLTIKVVTPEKEFHPDCVRVELEPELSKAIDVEPIKRLNEDGKITIPIHINNPVEKPVKASINWDFERTSWTPEPAEITIPGKGQSTLMVRAHYQDLYPIPEASLQLHSDHTTLVPCRFVERALAGLFKLIPAWNIIGPFGLVDKEHKRINKLDGKEFASLSPTDWNDQLPHGTKINYGATFNGKDNQEISWQIVFDHDRGGIDIGALFDEDYAGACAVAYLHSPKGGKYLLSLGSSDSIFVYINSQEIWRNQKIRTVAPDQDQFMIELNKGWNIVQLKIMNYIGVWGFYFQILDYDDSLSFGVAPEFKSPEQ